MIVSNFDPSLTWFFLATFLVIPVFNLLVLYAFSVGREIWLVQNHREMSLKEYREDPQEVMSLNES